MASSKGGRPAAGAASRSARTVVAVSATPTSRRAGRPAKAAAAPEPEPVDDDAVEVAEYRPSVQPLWLQVLTFVIAIGGLAVSGYETWAHFNGNHLAGCPTGQGGTFNCSAVITSPQSMVFGVIPVAILGLVFYLAAVPLFSPWAWRARWRPLHQLRLAGMVVGMGFVVYLIYAELTIGSICEYCTGIHAGTFALFAITVFSAAIWGLRGQRAELADRT